MKKKPEVKRTCGECIHEYACGAWNVGTLHSTDALHCVNFEAVKDSTAYFIGYRDGMAAVKRDMEAGLIPMRDAPS